MVKSLKNSDFSFKIGFLFKILVIVVRKNRLLGPILVRKNRLPGPLMSGKNGYSVQYEQEKMVTQSNTSRRK